MEQYWALLMLVPFVMGWAVGWIQSKYPLLEKVKELESVLEKDSAQKMERILALESQLRSQSQKALELESEMKWKQSRILALELDLERAQSKLMWKE